MELGILFFVDKIHVAPHVTSLHKSHHNHITTMSQVKVPLFMHMSLRYSVPNSSDVAPGAQSVRLSASPLLERDQFHRTPQRRTGNEPCLCTRMNQFAPRVEIPRTFAFPELLMTESLPNCCSVGICTYSTQSHKPQTASSKRQAQRLRASRQANCCQQVRRLPGLRQ